MLGVVANELKPVYLLTGSDRPKIARAVRRLRDRIGHDSTEHLNARETEGPDAVAACNAMGLFIGEGRLVIVDEVERWKAADVKEVVAYLASPAPATVLALVAEELKSDSALAKAVAKAKAVARPIPDAPPVMTTTFPVMSFDIPISTCEGPIVGASCTRADHTAACARRANRFQGCGKRTRSHGSSEDSMVFSLCCTAGRTHGIAA